MVTAIPHGTPAQHVAQPTGALTHKPVQPKPPSVEDSVKLSEAAIATLASLQKATPAPGQTSKESRSGHRQA